MLKKIVTSLLLLCMVFTSIPAAELCAQAAMPYSISIDLTNQIVTVYDTTDNSIVRQMLSSTGRHGSTPTGSFILPHKRKELEREEWYFFRTFNCYAKYATRIYKGIMFHSIPCSHKSESSISKKALENLGRPASHGCIRLRFEDAEFIAKNCLEGTPVKIYESDERDEDLRSLLLESSYSADSGMEYNHFLGIPDDPNALGRFSSGDEVRDLQYRLRALGYFDEEITGEYSGSTVTAMRQMQHNLNVEENGYATPDLLELIYSSEAPTATNVELSEGMSGPSVRKLQESLAALKLYSSDLDGIYDIDVIDAVSAFQKVYGYTVDGISTPTIQKAIHYEAGRLLAFFQDAPYSGKQVIQNVPLATVSARARVHVRVEPDRESKSIGKVSDGDSVVVLEKGDKWSKVQKGSETGYIKNSYLEFASREMLAMMYSSDETDVICTLGNTLEDYIGGAPLPADNFADFLASGSDLNDYEGISDYASVNTGSDGLKLNLRAAPSTDSEILAELENGTKMEVLLKTAVWSLVSIDNLQGYLMNDYLDYWSGPDGELSEEPSSEELHVEDAFEGTFYATVLEDADVFDADSDDAERLGSLRENTQVKVIESDDSWSLIEYQGRQGYMENDVLAFILTEDYI